LNPKRDLIHSANYLPPNLPPYIPFLTAQAQIGYRKGTVNSEKNCPNLCRPLTFEKKPCFSDIFFQKSNFFIPLGVHMGLYFGRDFKDITGGGAVNWGALYLEGKIMILGQKIKSVK